MAPEYPVTISADHEIQRGTSAGLLPVASHSAEVATTADPAHAATARPRPCTQAVTPSTAMAMMPPSSLMSSSSPVATPMRPDEMNTHRRVRHGCCRNSRATTSASSPPISDGNVKNSADAA